MLGQQHLPPVMTPLQDRSSQLRVYLWESLLCLHSASPPCHMCWEVVCCTRTCSVGPSVHKCSVFFAVITLIIRDTQMHNSLDIVVIRYDALIHVWLYKPKYPILIQIQPELNLTHVSKKASIWMHLTFQWMLCEWVICYNKDNTQRETELLFIR